MKNFLHRWGTSLALFCLLGSVAIAQTFTGAVQLSQDLRSFYLLDSNGNFYIQNNRHVLSQLTSAALPTVSGAACVITANSTDFNGQVTACTAAAAVTFSQPYVTAPRCVASSSNATNVALTVSTTATVLTITPNTNGAGTWNWFCSSVS